MKYGLTGFIYMLSGMKAVELLNVEELVEVRKMK